MIESIPICLFLWLCYISIYSPILSLLYCIKSKRLFTRLWLLKLKPFSTPLFLPFCLFGFLRIQTHKGRKTQKGGGKVENFGWFGKQKTMGAEKDDGLGLSLSLGCAQNHPSLKLNLMPLASPRMQNLQQKNTWNELFQSSGMFLVALPLFEF